MFPVRLSAHDHILRHVPPCLLFGLLGLLLYGHTLDAPFQLDDLSNIRDGLYAMTSLSLTEAVNAAFQSFANRRPLANLSFALNYYFHGYRLAGYHLVNISIHVMNGVLLYLLVFKTLTLRRSPNPEHPVWIAGLASLLWFVNPVQIQSVTYIVQRMTSMAALFYLASFLFYVYSREAEKRLTTVVLVAMSLLSFLLSVATKELAWTLPLLICCYEWFFFQELDKTWIKRFAIYGLIGVAASVTVACYVYDYNPLTLLTSTPRIRTFTALERLLTEGRVIFIYMSLLLYPHPSRLNLNHDIAISQSLLDPVTTLWSFIGLVVLLGILVFAAKRGHRIIAFCLAWFFVNVALEALVAGLEPMFEHRIYLPSMFFFVPFLLLVKDRPKIAVPVAATLIVVFAFWTHERNTLWTQPIAFWEDTVQKSPDHYRPHFNLGTSYLGAEAYDRAITAFEKSLAHSPPYPEEIYTNIGSAYIETGRYDAARRNLNRAVELNPKAYIAHNLLAKLERKNGNYTVALDQYKKAIKTRPNAYSYHGLGILYMDMKALNKAVEVFQRALTLRPNWANGYSSLGLARAKQGRLDLAIPILKQATNLDPGNEEALYNLATAYQTVGQHRRAADTYIELTKINPTDVQSLHNLGIIYYNHIPDMERARYYFKRALSVDPDYDHANAAKDVLGRISPNNGMSATPDR